MARARFYDIKRVEQQPLPTAPPTPRLPVDYGAGVPNSYTGNDYRNRMPFHFVDKNTGEEFYGWQYGQTMELFVTFEGEPELEEQPYVTDVLRTTENAEGSTRSIVDKETKIANLEVGTMAFTDASIYPKKTYFSSRITELMIRLNLMRSTAVRALLVTLVFLSILLGSANRWGYVLPYWWVEIYPLAYYAAGAWLREYPLKIGSGKLLALCAALAALMGAFGYLAAEGGTYLWQPEDNWNSWPLMLQGVALFSCLSRVRSAPRPVAWVIGRVAKLSLGMYLVSWVADQIVYPRLIAAVPAVHLRILWMPLTVLAAVLLSLILAQVVEWARAGLSRGINKICPKAELR